MPAALRNLLIMQGSDFEEIFQLRHSLRVRCEAIASNNVSTIKIHPSGVSLLAGETVRVGCDDLVLASALAVDSELLSVTSIPSSIANGSIIRSKPVDITGWSFGGSVKSQGGSAIAQLVCSIHNALNGQFKIVIPRSVTEALAATCIWTDLQGINLNDLGKPTSELNEIYFDEADQKRIAKLIAAAHRWDVEATDTNNKRRRQSEGYLLVSGEVTT